MAVAAAAATNIIKRLFFHRPAPNFQPLLRHRHGHLPSFLIIPINSFSTATATGRHSNKYKKTKSQQKAAADRIKTTESSVKRRTRSEKEFDEANVLLYGDDLSHIPVMLGEVLEVFASVRLRSFVDCTVGAGGHSSAMIQAHPEMELLVGMDVDPIACKMAQGSIKKILDANSCGSTSRLKARIFLRNFKDIKPVLHEIDENLLTTGVDGILMDLGMSSMQESLKAEDILNSWPDAEVGRILWEYGEESNWRSLQNKIVKARVTGGLHSTGQLVELIRNSTCRAKGRQGWIKTATRVFQALRIAVNDELKTLEDSLYACFDCLAPKGRLAVVSFHSLEDRIVKQTFLDIIKTGSVDEVGQEIRSCNSRTTEVDKEKEPWIKNMIGGQNGTVLTKRPITPSEEEEKLNRRSRSAKLRVIQKN